MLQLIRPARYLLRTRGCLTVFSLRQNFCQKATVNMLGHLAARIKFSGPLTVEEYMKECLTHPTAGYYVKKDIIGAKGDFITSPEISQMFGELIGVWVLNEWHKMGSPKPMQLIELGPGKATMLTDILRVMKQFKVSADDMELHLVEKSHVSSQAQADTLCISSQLADVTSKTETTLHYRSGKTKDGTKVFWYTHVHDIPDKFSIVLAHEFFDVLPIHKIRKTENGWREILIDIDPTKKETVLRYVLAKDESPASKFFVGLNEARDEVEFAPEAVTISNVIAQKLERHGGAALVIDYGHNGTLTDTFRAYQNHNQVDPLLNPGKADLTADVDFSLITKTIKDRMVTFGPVEQGEFLRNMGIEYRLRTLLKRAKNSKEAHDLASSSKMLMDNDQMGERFKVYCFYPNVLQSHLEKYPPAGFTKIPLEE